MKKNVFVIAVTFTMLYSCGSDSTIAEDTNPDVGPEPAGVSRLQEITEVRRMNIEEYKSFTIEHIKESVRGGLDDDVVEKLSDALFNSRVPKMEREFGKENNTLTSRNWHIEIYDYLYRSVSTTGDSVTLSGMLCIPYPDNAEVTHRLNGITLYCPPAITCDSERCYNRPLMMDLRTLLDNAVVFYDSEGFGASVDRPVPFFDGYAKGRQAIDALIASKEILDSIGLMMECNWYVESLGSSLGSQDAVGAHKYISSDDCPSEVRDMFPNFRTLAGSGVYNVEKLFRGYMENNDSIVYSDVTLYLVNTIYAKNKELLGGYDRYDFFSQAVRDLEVEELDGNKEHVFEALDKTSAISHTIRDAMGKVGNGTLAGILAPDMLNADSTVNMSAEKTQLLLNGLKNLRLDQDFKTDYPITIAHSKNDDVLYYEYVYPSIEAIRASSDNVKFVTIPGDHPQSTVLSSLRFILFEHPSFTMQSNPTMDYIMDLLKKK